MRCEQWREMLSAQLDGEETLAERAAAEGHLDACGDCSAWFDAAAAVTRRARTRLVSPGPDLADAVLAAVPAGASPAGGRPPGGAGWWPGCGPRWAWSAPCNWCSG